MERHGYRRRWAWAAMVAVVGAVGVSAGELRPEALRGYERHRADIEARRAAEQLDRRRFLAMDFTPEGADLRRRALSGEVVVTHVDDRGPDGRAVDLPAAAVHHWRGAAFLPGMTIDGVLAELAAGTPMARQDDVLASAVLARSPGHLTVFLRLRRKKIVTVVLDTEHEVTYRRDGSTRAMSASTATKIAEVEAPGTPAERELAPGDDRGFLWRLDAWWRYEQVPGGVVAEWETLSLSRDVPMLVRYLAGPIINGIARESLVKSLRALQAR
jgi:hypothetical protein